MTTECLGSHQKEVGVMKRRPTIEKIEFKDYQKKDVHAFHPRFRQFAHFHYEHVDFDCLQAKVDDDGNEESELCGIRVEVDGKVWVVHRTYEHLQILDKQLHSCVYDRSISKLLDLQQLKPASVEEMRKIIKSYIEKFSELAKTCTFHCGTVLHFFEADNRGNRLVLQDDSSAINIPAIAAARAIKPYVSQAADELSLEVGDMVSVIDKPSPQESTWWRGKKTFEVGFFPSECVELIGSSGVHRSTDTTDTSGTKPVLLRRGKVITFLRMFFSSRPNRTSLKRNGIVKERVFGCDLGEHLSNCLLSVPQVLQLCCQVVEERGMIDGIYRLSGVASHVQLLRAKFDDGTVESIDDEMLEDLHTTTSVLKMYFRELPNPLITYQLYESFCRSVEHKGEDRLIQLKNSVARLPPPHHRTAKYLFSHLHQMSENENKTGMNSKNLAIVWSPNLLRSEALETGKLSAPEVLHTISVQATIVESLITNYKYVFGVDDTSLPVDVLLRRVPIPRWRRSCKSDGGVETRNPVFGRNQPSRLLSLVEAQQMLMKEAPPESMRKSAPVYRETGSGSCMSADFTEQDIVPVFHTVIDFSDRKSGAGCSRESYTSVASNSTSGRTGAATGAYSTFSSREKSPSRWRSFFHKNRAHSTKSHKKNYIETWLNSAQPGEKEDELTITDSDIGHLTRPSPTAAPSTDFSKLKSTLSLTNLDLSATGSSSDLLQRQHTPTSDDTNEPGLIRSASHESFFDPTNQMLVVPTSAPTYDSESLEKAVVTPGVVFKPAYSDPNALIKIPQGTWKGSLGLGVSTQRFHSQSTLLSAKHSERLPTQLQHSDSTSSHSYTYSKGMSASSTIRSLDPSASPELKPLDCITKPSMGFIDHTVNQKPSALSESLPLDSFEQEWQRLEMEQCVNQAEQARLSRSYSSAHSNCSTDRQQRGNRRRYTGESTSESTGCSSVTNTPVSHSSLGQHNEATTTQDASVDNGDCHIYANVDPLNVKNVTTSCGSTSQVPSAMSREDIGQQVLPTTLHTTTTQQVLPAMTHVKATQQIPPHLSHVSADSQILPTMSHINTPQQIPPPIPHIDPNQPISPAMSHVKTIQQMPPALDSVSIIPHIPPARSHVNNTQQIPPAISHTNTIHQIPPMSHTSAIQQIPPVISHANTTQQIPPAGSLINSTQQNPPAMSRVNTTRQVSPAMSHHVNPIHHQQTALAMFHVRPAEQSLPAVSPVYPTQHKSSSMSHATPPSSHMSSMTTSSQQRVADIPDTKIKYTPPLETYPSSSMTSKTVTPQVLITNTVATTQPSISSDTKRMVNMPSYTPAAHFDYKPSKEAASTKSSAFSLDSVDQDGTGTGLTDAFSFSINNINLLGTSPTSAPSSHPSTPVANQQRKAVHYVPRTAAGKSQASVRGYDRRPYAARNELADRPHSVYCNTPPAPPTTLSPDSSAAISLPDLTLPDNNTQMHPIQDQPVSVTSKNTPNIINSSNNSTQSQGSSRSRAHSVPFKMSVDNRRKESDVDTAIANSPNPLSSAQHYINSGRKPSRNMEYVNQRSYDPDKRRAMRRHHSEDSGYTPAADMVNEQPVDTEPIYANVVIGQSLSNENTQGKGSPGSPLTTDVSAGTSAAKQKRRTPVALPRLNSKESPQDRALTKLDNPRYQHIN